MGSIESGLAMARQRSCGHPEHWGEVSDLNTDQEVQDYLDSKFDGDYNDGIPSEESNPDQFSQ